MSVVPPFGAATVEQVCKALGEAVTGAQIANLLVPLRVAVPTSSTDTKWRRLHNAVAEAQNRQGDGRPLLRLVSEVMQPVRFSSNESFQAARERVSEALLYSGYVVREDGKVARAKAAATVNEAQERTRRLRAELERRGVHERVLTFCRDELLAENFFHAVLEASKSLAARVRAMSGLEGDGARLIDAAFGAKSGTPLIAYNALITDWEKDEQAGLAMLMKGVFATYRNPSAHAPRVEWATSQAEALDMMTIASMLHRRLDNAVVRRKT